MAVGLKLIGIPFVLLILQTSISKATRPASSSLQIETNHFSSIRQNRTGPPDRRVQWRRINGRLVRLSDMEHWIQVDDAAENSTPTKIYLDARTGERTTAMPEEVAIEKGFPPGLEYKLREVDTLEKQYQKSVEIMQQLAGLRPALQGGSSLLQNDSTDGALPGQMLSISRRGMYLHWGIYIGDGNVIQVEAPSNGGIHGESRISQVTVEEFAAGDELCIQDIHDTDEIEPGYSLEDSVRRAKALLGKTIEYDLFRNNCQHFAYETRTGKHLNVVSRIFNHNYNFVANALSGITHGLVHALNGTRKLWSLKLGGTPV